MLSILSTKPTTLCDHPSRRHFLKLGGLALGGMSLPNLLRAEAASAPQGAATRSNKAIIMIYLSGGPSHQDMYDLKMDAPVEIRGSLQPIATNVTGIQICEHMPRLARMMDKFAIIRSLYGSVDQHASDLCLSGYPNRRRFECEDRAASYSAPDNRFSRCGDLGQRALAGAGNGSGFPPDAFKAILANEGVQRGVRHETGKTLGEPRRVLISLLQSEDEMLGRSFSTSMGCANGG